MSIEEKDAIFCVSQYLSSMACDKMIEYAHGKIATAELNFWVKSSINYSKYERNVYLKYGF